MYKTSGGSGAAHLSDATYESLMRLALEEARTALEQGEAPIGCVLASGRSGRIYARAFNRMNETKRRTAHAEILAFEQTDGGVIPPDEDCLAMVSTLEPCVMCTGAAMEAGVRFVVFGLSAPADSGMSRVAPPESPEASNPIVIQGVFARESRLLFERFSHLATDLKQIEFTRQLLELTDENGEAKSDG